MNVEELRSLAEQERERQRAISHRVLYCSAAGCISCGLCVKKCPAQAVSLENGRITVDHKACMAFGPSCGLACVAFCPRSIMRSIGGETPAPKPEARPEAREQAAPAE